MTMVPSPGPQPATTPLSEQQLAEIDARAAHLYEYVEQPAEADVLAGEDAPALLAEVDRLKVALKTATDYVAELESDLGGATAQAAALNACLHAVGAARTYRLQSGKKSIYVEDIADAVQGRKAEAGDPR